MGHAGLASVSYPRLSQRLERQELFSRVPGRQRPVFLCGPPLTLQAGARSSRSNSLFTDRNLPFPPQKKKRLHSRYAFQSAACPRRVRPRTFIRCPENPGNDRVRLVRSTSRLSMASNDADAIKYCRAR